MAPVDRGAVEDEQARAHMQPQKDTTTQHINTVAQEHLATTRPGGLEVSLVHLLQLFNQIGLRAVAEKKRAGGFLGPAMIGL